MIKFFTQLYDKNYYYNIEIRRVTMSQPSGFVPVKFHLAGRILLIIGIIGLVLIGVSKLTGWYALPPSFLVFSLATILVSLYLIFVVPREK
jgi:hypothetical protein